MISRYCLLILTNVSIIGLQNITEINQTSLGFRQTTISSLHEVFLFIKSTASWFLKLFFLNEVDLKSDCTNKQMTTHKIYNWLLAKFFDSNILTMKVFFKLLFTCLFWKSVLPLLSVSINVVKLLLFTFLLSLSL